jgi:hypothetical protein
MTTRPTRPTHSPRRRAGGTAHTRPGPYIGPGVCVCACPRGSGEKSGRMNDAQGLLFSPDADEWPRAELALPDLETPER